MGILSSAYGAVSDAVGYHIGNWLGANTAQNASARQFQYNMALQKQAQEWNEYMYKHRYQFQREDLESAGINALYGLGNAPSVTSGMNSVGMPDEVGMANGRQANAIQMASVAQEWSAKQVAMKKMEQETKTEEVNTLLKQLETVNQDLRNTEQDLKNKWQTEENKQQKERFKYQLENLKSQTVFNLKAALKAEIEAFKAKQEGEISARRNKWEKDNPGLYNWDQTSKSIETSVGMFNDTLDAIGGILPWGKGRGKSKSSAGNVQEYQQNANGVKNNNNVYKSKKYKKSYNR